LARPLRRCADEATPVWPEGLRDPKGLSGPKAYSFPSGGTHSPQVGLIPLRWSSFPSGGAHSPQVGLIPLRWDSFPSGGTHSRQVEHIPSGGEVSSDTSTIVSPGCHARPGGLAGEDCVAGCWQPPLLPSSLFETRCKRVGASMMNVTCRPRLHNSSLGSCLIHREDHCDVDEPHATSSLRSSICRELGYRAASAPPGAECVCARGKTWAF